MARDDGLCHAFLLIWLLRSLFLSSGGEYLFFTAAPLRLVLFLAPSVSLDPQARGPRDLVCVPPLYAFYQIPVAGL